MLLSQGVLLNTLAYNSDRLMGSLWAILMRSVQYNPLRPLVKVVIVHMGVQHDPLWPKVKYLFTGVSLIWPSSSHNVIGVFPKQFIDSEGVKSP